MTESEELAKLINYFYASSWDDCSEEEFAEFLIASGFGKREVDDAMVDRALEAYKANGWAHGVDADDLHHIVRAALEAALKPRGKR